MTLSSLSEIQNMNDEPKAEESLLELKRRGNRYIDELARGANPAAVSEVGQRKLFEEWERAGKTIAQAKQMLLDAVKHEQRCAENIVKKLGRGQWRYKEVLYTCSAKGTTVYLKALKARP